MIKGAVQFEVVDMPLWKERCIYALLRLFGYKTADWILLEQVNDEEGSE